MTKERRAGGCARRSRSRDLYLSLKTHARDPIVLQQQDGRAARHARSIGDVIVIHRG